MGDSNFVPFCQIATEGGLLASPLPRRSFQLAPAIRADVIIDFSSAGLPPQVFLQNCLQQTNGRRPDGVDTNNCTPIIRFDLGGVSPDPVVIPAMLRTIVPLAEADAVQTREFRFERSHGAWAVNGELFDFWQNHPIASPLRSTVEIWRLVNSSGGWAHPIHIHNVFFQVLDRNGARPTSGSEESGWRETVNLGPGDEVRVILQFSDWAGPYVFHCHNLEYEDMAMMARIDVLCPDGTPATTAVLDNQRDTGRPSCPTDH